MVRDEWFRHELMTYDVWLLVNDQLSACHMPVELAIWLTVTITEARRGGPLRPATCVDGFDLHRRNSSQVSVFGIVFHCSGACYGVALLALCLPDASDMFRP